MGTGSEGDGVETGIVTKKVGGMECPSGTGPERDGAGNGHVVGNVMDMIGGGWECPDVNGNDPMETNDVDTNGGGLECQSVAGTVPMETDDTDGGGGDTVPYRGTNTITKFKTSSERTDNGGGGMMVGANDGLEGRGGVRDAIKMMMQRKIPRTIKKKPLKKHSKGAKSVTKKGKIQKTDSSQPGMRRFLCSRKKVIEEICLDIGSGTMNSHGSSLISHKNL